MRLYTVNCDDVSVCVYVCVRSTNYFFFPPTRLLCEWAKRNTIHVDCRVYTWWTISIFFGVVGFFSSHPYIDTHARTHLSASLLHMHASSLDTANRNESNWSHRMCIICENKFWLIIRLNILFANKECSIFARKRLFPHLVENVSNGTFGPASHAHRTHEVKKRNQNVCYTLCVNAITTWYENFQ